MAVIFDTIDEGLQRLSGLIPASTAYYTATWWVYLPATPSSGVIRTLYMVANSAARATESIVIAQRDTGEIYLEVAGTARPGAVIAPGWHAVAHGRRAAQTFIEVLIDNVQISSSPSIAFSGWSLNELYLGVDPRRTGAAQQAAFFREWPAFLGSYTAEWQSPVPIRTSDLDTDTPLSTDLLDVTAHDHDWTHVGGGALTFSPVPASREGAIGGWWFYSTWALPINPPECCLRVQQADRLGDTAARLIVEARIIPTGSTATAQPDGSTLITDVRYDVHLRYGNGPNASDIVDLVVSDPVADPANGYRVPAGQTAGPRTNFSIPWRWALVFRCSTWQAATETFAADGQTSLWLNDTLLLNISSIVIPRRPDGHGLQYTVGILADCDRIWGRTVDAVPATTTEGAFTSGLPSGLVYYDEFDSGVYPDWTVTELFSGGGGDTPAPTSYVDCGGENGWGLSTYGAGPTVVDPGLVVPYTGLMRFVRFPPMVVGQTGENGGGGNGGPQPPEVAPSYHLDARYIRRLRRAPHLGEENRRIGYRRFELDLERGVGTPTGQGADPLVLLRVSRDAGHTWSEPVTMSAGQIGAYSQRVIARRLGLARDAVFEVTVSDPVAWSLVQAWLDLEPGAS